MKDNQFEYLGIDEKYMQFPEMAGKYSGLLVIVSSGRCVWEDYEKVDKQHQVMCINDMIMHFPGKIEHAYSNDHKMLPHWASARRPRHVTEYGLPKHFHTNKTQPARLKANIWPWPGHGSSSLNAIYTGLALGYEQIWLCGIPLDNSGHYFDPPWQKSNFINEVSQREEGPKYWGNAKKKLFRNRVKSFSGRTRELLGEPHESQS